ncbi:SnoaL-like protein [Solirubrobacter pauli]|uniref:SnoaL-like protein n=1 Tax=Solirubrobacter pauli TaxID=166793 RepID=A0A660L2U2_9ACTN|nr:nuclear transport factor 2 family protein [Solirubrobacter pauli]RKQ88311.1 SnoaL-like protein [Solirubrobacter pauli]
MTAITLPRAIETFVAATNAHDAKALEAAFAPGATIVDAGTTFATEAELREFFQVHLVNPKIVLTPTSYEDGRLVASGDGDFPGGPLSFAFTFGIDDDVITDPVIEPV